MEQQFIISLHHDIIKEKFHYPILSYKVELCGSWNDWTIGYPAEMNYEMSKSKNKKKKRIAICNAKIKLDKGIYEYKWKFSYNDIDDPLKTHVVWLNDTINNITNNEQWNQNNLFIL
jgi:hypothetical protein